MSGKFHPAMIGLVGLAFAALMFAWGAGREFGREEQERRPVIVDGAATEMRCDGTICRLTNASGQVVAWWMQDGTGPTWPAEKKEPTP